jgi:hypothetical protein
MVILGQFSLLDPTKHSRLAGFERDNCQLAHAWLLRKLLLVDRDSQMFLYLFIPLYIDTTMYNNNNNNKRSVTTPTSAF